MRTTTGLALAAAAWMAATPAAAAWHQATSRHFVVYADAAEREVRATAVRLERFDAAMRRLHQVPAEPAQPANRVTVYVVNGGPSAIERLYGAGGRYVGGFYLPRSTGSVAFTPRRMGTGGNDLTADIVLFHEYAHHFLLGNYAGAYPAWFSEGYAEFVSTTTFEKDGSVMLGRAAQHRAAGLFGTARLPAEAMFAPAGRPLDDRQRELLYGRGWLLTHMCLTNAARRTQFSAYLHALNDGRPSLDAARAAFGDLKTLDRDLDTYLGRSLQAFRIPVPTPPDADIAVRPLDPGERALIDLRIVSERGVDRAAGQALFARAAPIAARFPADAGAQGWFAEMAFDAGRDAEAEGAADRAIAADPRSAQALLYKARVHMRRAAEAKNPAAWKEARSWIIRANRLAPDEAEPLVLYHASFVAAGETPTRSAAAGLFRAMELVPQDPDLRFTVARQALVDGRADDARLALRPLAYDPHAGADNLAMQLLRLLGGGDTGPALARMDQPPPPK